MKVENLKVYDLQESLIASGYPLSENLDNDGKAKQKDLERCLQSIKDSANNITDNQWLSGITVSFDLTCTKALWDDIDKYNLFKVAGQESYDALFNLDIDKMFNNFVDSRVIAIVKEKVAKYINLCENQPPSFNTATWESEKEKLKNKILYNIPSGIEITTRVKTDYKNLINIYLDNNNSDIKEWQEFCNELLNLPIFKLLVDIYKSKGD